MIELAPPRSRPNRTQAFRLTSHRRTPHPNNPEWGTQAVPRSRRRLLHPPQPTESAKQRSPSTRSHGLPRHPARGVLIGPLTPRPHLTSIFSSGLIRATTHPTGRLQHHFRSPRSGVPEKLTAKSQFIHQCYQARLIKSCAWSERAHRGPETTEGRPST